MKKETNELKNKLHQRISERECPVWISDKLDTRGKKWQDLTSWEKYKHRDHARYHKQCVECKHSNNGWGCLKGYETLTRYLCLNFEKKKDGAIKTEISELKNKIHQYILEHPKVWTSDILAAFEDYETINILQTLDELQAEGKIV